jgi:hypothetical protein
MKKSVLLGALLALPFAAAAEGLSYNYVQLDWIADTELEAGGGSADGDGYNLGGVFSINETFYLMGDYEDLGFDGGLDLQTISVGVGVHSNAFTGGVDVFGNLTYEDVELGGLDDNGFGLEVGVRSALGEGLDGYISYDYSDVGDLEGGFFKIGANWAFNPNWSVVGEYLTGDYDVPGGSIDRDDLTLGLRYNF